MFTQYWIVDDLLALLECTSFERTDLITMQHLLYQLKILLLRKDECRSEVIDDLCPQAELEQWHAMLLSALSFPGALAIKDQFGEELNRMIERLEKA
jgi:hypothetical protein